MPFMVSEMQSRAFAQAYQVDACGGNVLSQRARGEMEGGMFGGWLCEVVEELGRDEVHLSWIRGRRGAAVSVALDAERTEEIDVGCRRFVEGVRWGRGDRDHGHGDGIE